MIVENEMEHKGGQNIVHNPCIIVVAVGKKTCLRPKKHWSVGCLTRGSHEVAAAGGLRTHGIRH